MEIETKGKVVVSARIDSLRDTHEFETGRLSADDIRSIEVTDAVVDTSAAMLSIPERLIRQLGLKGPRRQVVRTAAGSVPAMIYDAVRLTVQGRDCIVEVAELPDEFPVLIGIVPLGALDFVVDPVEQKLVGNPDHGGKHMIDMF